MPKAGLGIRMHFLQIEQLFLMRIRIEEIYLRR